MEVLVFIQFTEHYVSPRCAPSDPPKHTLHEVTGVELFQEW